KVIALAVHRGGIVRLPEHFQELRKRDLCFIKYDLANFCMACCAGAHFLVRRILNRSAAVAAFYAHHAIQPLENRLHAPEAARTKSGGVNASLRGSRLHYLFICFLVHCLLCIICFSLPAGTYKKNGCDKSYSHF